MKKKIRIFSQLYIMNYLVISIMLLMVVLTLIFIFSNIHLKDRITYRIVKQTELVSDLITRSSTDLMKNGHNDDTYKMILEYGNMIGVKEIIIFDKNGKEAFDGFRTVGENNDEEDTRAIRRKIADDDISYFKKLLETMNVTAYFDHDKKTYERFEPLLAVGSCLRCHKSEDDLLGVLQFTLSTKEDFQVLTLVQRFIWVLGLIVIMPIVGILVIGFIIKDKNKLLADLHTANEDIKRTYQDLDATKYYLELILNNSKAIIISTDIDTNIVEFNKEASNLLGYPRDEVVGTSVLDLYDDPEQRNELIREQTSEIWAATNKEIRLKTKAGNILHVSMSISTLVNDLGEVIGTVAIGKDISEERMLQFKLLQSEKLAGIGTLASGIAHEINNPLAGILGMAEAIRDEDDLETIKSYTDDIIQYSLNASVIVKEMSSYSRTARNDATSTVDISQVLTSSLKMAKHSAPLTSIETVTDLTKDTFIFANAGELQQVFVNLIINAIHAIGDKGVLTVTCCKVNGFAKACITDTGEGIPKKNISQVFDPFFTTKPAGSGTGLGLYVVFRIVTKYGGTIDVTSTPGLGTTFTIKFPSTHDNEGNHKLFNTSS